MGEREEAHPRHSGSGTAAQGARAGHAPRHAAGSKGEAPAREATGAKSTSADAHASRHAGNPQPAHRGKPQPAGRKKRKPSPAARRRRFLRKYRVPLLLGCLALVIGVAGVLLFSFGSGKEEAQPVAELPATQAVSEPSSGPGATPVPAPDTTAPAEVASTPGELPGETATPSAAPATATVDPAGALFELAYPGKYKVRSGAMQTNHALGLPKGEAVDDSFFNDTCFVGDSITLGLRNYVMEERKKGNPNLLGNATFLATGSFGVQKALEEVSEDSLHPSYKGKKTRIEDALADQKAKKVYIMLGMNDVAGVGPAKTVSCMAKLVQRIFEKNPDIQIFIESVTPRMHGLEPGTGTLFKYDIALYEALLEARLENVYFVDVAYVMRDERGFLKGDYCSDPDGKAMHFSGSGSARWVKYLYTHTPPTAGDPAAA